MIYLAYFEHYFSRGYYPKGGGEVRITVEPISQLKAVTMVDSGSVIKLMGQAFVAGVLPIKVNLLYLSNSYILDKYQ